MTLDNQTELGRDHGAAQALYDKLEDRILMRDQVGASEVYYEITPAYQPQASAGIIWSDPAFAIPWPFQPEVISERDQMLPASADYFSKLHAGAPMRV